MDSMSTLPLIVVLVAVILGSITDLRNFRLPNVLTFPFSFMGLVFHALQAGDQGVVFSLLGLGIATGPLVVLYCAGGMGAGDLKLMAGVGAWLGPWVGFHVLAFSCLAMGLCSMALLHRLRRKPLAIGGAAGIGGDATTGTDRYSNVQLILQRADRRSRAVPFAPFVALGVIATAFWLGH
jgi:Flp pilus assembly protein protease CpaA